MSKIAESKKNGEKIEKKKEKVNRVSKASKIDEMIEKNKANAKKVSDANKKESTKATGKSPKESAITVAKKTNKSSKESATTVAKKTDKSLKESATTVAKKTATNSNIKKQNNTVEKNKSNNSAKEKKSVNEKINTNSQNIAKKITKDSVKNIEEKNSNEESKYDTISLKEIREAIENKVDKNQKKSIIKDIMINIGIALLMIVYLAIVYMGSKNIVSDILEKDLKIITLIILGFGIIGLEIAYKRDKFKIVLNSVETLILGGANLCLIYVVKLYFNNFTKVVSYMVIAIIGYYVIKILILTIISIKKFRKNNNDIKEIIKK